MNETINNQVFEGFRKGEEESFRKVYDLYFPIISRYIQAKCTHKEDAEDLTLETFYQLYKYRKAISEPEKIYPYLFVIAKRTLISHFRKELSRKRDQRITIDFEQVSSSISDTLKEVDYKELNQIYQQIVSSLPEQQQKAYSMFHFEGRSQMEIADMLHVTRNTIKNHLALASKTIRLKIQKMYFPLFFLFYFLH